MHRSARFDAYLMRFGAYVMSGLAIMLDSVSRI
jgi:hypothetical protein